MAGEVRIYASDVGLEPPVGGETTVQGALEAGGGGGGGIIYAGVETDGPARRMTATAPITTSDVSGASPNVAAITLVVPPAVYGAGDSIINGMWLAWTAFTAARLLDIGFRLYVSDLTGTNTAVLDLSTLDTFTAGPIPAGEITPNLTADPPTITGTDLGASGSTVTTTAGGVFSVCVVFEIVSD